MAFFYLNLELIQLDLFKIIKDNGLVDEEDGVLLTTTVPTQDAEVSSEKNEGYLVLDVERQGEFN